MTTRKRTVACALALTALLSCATPPSIAPPRRIVRDAKACERAYSRGRQLANAGEHVKAVEQFGAAVAADPLFGLAYLEKAESHLYSDGDLVAMRSLLEKAVELLPDNPRARLRHGSLLAELGDTDGAVAEWRKAIALRPDLVDARMAYAGYLERSGATRDAVRQLEEAVRFAPKNVQIRVRLSQLYAVTERFAEAAIQVEIAADFVGGSAPLYRRAAGLYESAGNEREAARMREIADRIDPPARARELRELKRARRRRR